MEEAGEDIILYRNITYQGREVLDIKLFYFSFFPYVYIYSRAEQIGHSYPESGSC